MSKAEPRSGETFSLPEMDRSSLAFLTKQPDWFPIILTCIKEAVLAADPQGRILFLNEAAQAMTGWSLEDAVGLALGNVLHFVDENNQGLDNLSLDKIFHEGKATQVPQGFLVNKKDGPNKPVENQIVPVHDPQKNHVGWIIVCRDVSADKLAEFKLKEAERRKDEFLATLAHELRNPLAPIRNALHILKLTRDNIPLADQAREMMERQIQQMVRLVDDLLDVSRISRGKIELRKERVELVLVVNSALETSRPLVEEAGHELIVSLPSQPILLEVDPTRLAQVLSNLINNAAKYTEPGGKIYLVVRRQGPEIVITIRDTGIGIPPDMLPRIFDMFTQVPQASKRYQGGLGIGLTLVKSLVQMHGGTVEARSEGPGKGSEMVIRLPAGPATPDTPASEAPSAKNFLNGRKPRLRILVADDNKDSAESLGKVLDLMGYEVQTVNDGDSALAAFAVFHPDLAILDIGMPGLSGLEVAQQIRQKPEANRTMLVALTGWGMEEVRQRSREAGFDQHLVKPVEPEELITLLTNLDRARHAP